jgi:hypothetical protein
MPIPGRRACYARQSQSDDRRSEDRIAGSSRSTDTRNTCRLMLRISPRAVVCLRQTPGFRGSPTRKRGRSTHTPKLFHRLRFGLLDTRNANIKTGEWGYRRNPCQGKLDGAQVLCHSLTFSLWRSASVKNFGTSALSRLKIGVVDEATWPRTSALKKGLVASSTTMNPKNLVWTGY